MTPIPCTHGKGGVRGESRSAAEEPQNPQHERQGQLLSPAQLGGTALVLSQDCLGKWEGFPVKLFHRVQQRQSQGARRGRHRHSKKYTHTCTPPSQTIPAVCRGKGRPMNWEFDKDFLQRAPALSTAPSVFPTPPPPSLAGFLVWALNSAPSLFGIQVNDNHVINTHSHTHARAHTKSFLRASSLLQTRRRERRPRLGGAEAAAVAGMGTATGMDERAPLPLCKIPFLWRWAREAMRGRRGGGGKQGLGFGGGRESCPAASSPTPGRLAWVCTGCVPP